jgi:hypothetical protein
MPFCPACDTEYTGAVIVCPDCETTLVSSLEPSRSPSSEDTQDVFLCFDAQLAERMADLLRAGGLSPLVREHFSSALPLPVGGDGERRVAVAASEVERARALITQAMLDGVIGEHDGRTL